MFKFLIRSFFGKPTNAPTSVAENSGEVGPDQKDQTLSSITLPETQPASAYVQVGKTAYPCATVVEFSDPPVKGGVIYVLASRGHQIYTVDLNELTCDCPQFSASKRNMARNQVHKYCTHLFQQARQMGFCRSPSPKHELVAGYFHHLEHSGFAIGDRFYLPTIDQNDVLVVQKAYTSWVDVLTRKKRAKDSTICTGDIESYGYNAPSNRWSYGAAPFHPMQIKSFIHTLPSLASTASHHDERNYKFPLLDFMRLDPLKGNAHSTLVDRVFAHLREITEVNLIEAALETLQTFAGVNQKRLAFEWYEHGRNLQTQGSNRAAYFLSMAKETDPKIGKKVEATIASASSFQTKLSGKQNVAKSLEEYKEVEQKKNRARLANIDRELINVTAEEVRFNQLPNTPRKLEAAALLKTENPEWYSHDAGHTFRGYLYADFVKHSAARRHSKQRAEEETVVDYIASLAVLDGTIADRVMAEMFRAKAEIAINRHEQEFALNLFRQALAYNPNAGVKNIVRRLETNGKP